MVTVLFGTDIASNMFRYCMGRILAENLELELNCPGINGFANSFQRIDGKKVFYPKVFIDGHKLRNAVLNSTIPDFSHLRAESHLVLKGAFDYAPYYVPFEDTISRYWFAPQTMNQTATSQHAVVHLRWNTLAKVFDPGLENIHAFLCKYGIKTVTVISGEWSPQHALYVSRLKKFVPTTYMIGDVLTLIAKARECSVFIGGVSPESWWCGFLSAARHVITVRRRISEASSLRQKRNRNNAGTSQLWLNSGRYEMYVMDSI